MGPDPGWSALVLLFAASLLTVAAWLLQYWRAAALRVLWRRRRPPVVAEEEAGARALLAALLALRSLREQWQRAWVRALNSQARRHGSSVQITFEEGPQLPPAANISCVTCKGQSDCSMVRLCCSEFDLGPRSKELKLQVLGSSGRGEDVLLAHTTLLLDPSSKRPSGRQICSLAPGPGQSLAAEATIVLELLYQDSSTSLNAQHATSLRTSITPTKKVEMDRTIMPDGTIVTTVTTIQSRPKADCKLDSPSRSPSKVEVTEKKTTVLLESSCPRSLLASSSRDSQMPNGLDPVAETAIRQLTETNNKPAKKTPTKRSTLIISGVSKVPIAQDEMALSLGYAASMEATVYGASGALSAAEQMHDSTESSQLLEASPSGPGASQELDETTRSDISERPSMEDVESETGSTGALETRSLKDHKVSFLRSGTKLIFRRKTKQKEAGLSQSHDDLTNVTTSSASKKKAGSFSHRLIKRFSFKSKSKPKANDNTTGEN
eukprot:XP_027299933.1 phospholipid transfer protein C2CD2L [Anas platyrhynchos]